MNLMGMVNENTVYVRVGIFLKQIQIIEKNTNSFLTNHFSNEHG